MSNLGKAIYMAAFAFLFVIAATTSIYLYGTLNTYLNSTTETLGMSQRAEGASIDSTSSTARDITRSEIYITLFNMEQMHVNSLTVNGNTVTPKDVDDYKISKTSGKSIANRSIINILNILNNYPNKKYTYSINDNNDVTYRSR